MSKRIAWNKGLKLSKLPQYSKMGFQKGNKLSDNPKSVATRIKKGQHLSSDTELKKGHISWISGKGELFAGDKNPCWRGGIAFRKKSDRAYDDSAYMEWRKKVKNRDNWRCKIANEDCRGHLQAHHILPWRDYPELRYELNNGITLCHAHHPRKRAEEKRLIPYFQELVSES
jgi:hypothetical protein